MTGPMILYRATRSRRALSNVDAVRRELERTIDEKVKPLYYKRFKEVVANWSSDVDFELRKFIRPDGISLRVYPRGEDAKIWVFVSHGTKRHTITAKNAPFLIFVWGGKGSYVPKTTSGGGFGGPGIVMGGKVVGAKRVNHPGNAPRDFEKRIQADLQPECRYIMELAWRRGIRAMGGSR